MVIILLYLIILLISIELLLVVFISFLQSRISWIITNKDEYPVFEEIKVKNFLRKTYDPILGWNWKPKTKHQEKINSKYNNIFFGDLGERKSSFSKKK